MTPVYKGIENSLYERLMNKAEKTDKEAEMNANVIESIPASIRSKATRLLTYLKQAKAIDWNEKGEIFYKNNPVTESHIVDIRHFKVGQYTKRIKIQSLFRVLRIARPSNHSKSS